MWKGGGGHITGKLTNDAQAKKCASMVKCFDGMAVVGVGEGEEAARSSDKYAVQRARAERGREQVRGR